MRIWTIQSNEVIDIIEKNGEYICDPAKDSAILCFWDAYIWMCIQMDKKKIYHPEKCLLPIWGWYRREFKNKKPDLRFGGYAKRGTKCVCIELEIPDEDVLLSDFYAWHSVLNNSPFIDKETEEEWEAEFDRIDALSPVRYEEEKLQSWQKIFDIESVENSFMKKGCYVQATFWKIKKEYIKKVQYFTAR